MAAKLSDLLRFPNPVRRSARPRLARAASRRPRSARYLACAALVGLVAGVSLPTFSAERGPVRSLLEMREQGVVMQEWDLSCGAAALTTILNHQHGDRVSEREVAEGLVQRKEYLDNPMLVKIRQGFSLLDLKKYVDRRGYVGIGYGQMTVEDLVENAPVIVPVNFNGYNHFVVFRGSWRGQVLLADPAFGNRTLDVNRFKEAWLEYPNFGRVGFVVARHDGNAPPNGLAPRPEHFVMLR